jgi:glycosyltransferase involved in cell wall biosynthesis
MRRANGASYWKEQRRGLEMRIGILLLAVGRKAGGIETYEVGLLRALADLDQANQYIIYCTDAKAQSAVGIHQKNFQFHVLRPRSRFVSLLVTLPFLLYLHKIDILHATFAPPPWVHSKLVFTCHGLSNFLYPESFSPLTRLRLNWLYRIAIRRAERIVCVSEYTARQLQHEMNVSRDRLAVVAHGVDDVFHPASRDAAKQSVARKFNVESPFVLYVGKLQKIKNVARLIEAFLLFRARHPEVKLVLAGRNLHEPSLLPRHQKEQGIVRLGHVGLDDVADLYRAAEMLLFPSLFESFGMPAVEAMRCGTPVVASNAAAIPEVCGDGAYFVDPYSVEDMVNAMEAVYSDPSLRESLIQRGLRQSQQYSWHSAARKTLDVYTEVFYEGTKASLASETHVL